MSKTALSFQILTLLSSLSLLSSEAYANRITRSFNLLSHLPNPSAFRSQLYSPFSLSNLWRQELTPSSRVWINPKFSTQGSRSASLPTHTPSRLPLNSTHELQILRPSHRSNYSSYATHLGYGMSSLLSSLLISGWIVNQLHHTQDSHDSRTASDHEAWDETRLTQSPDLAAENPARPSHSPTHPVLHLLNTEEYSPETLVTEVSNLYPALKSLFEKDAQVSEGYTIGEHTTRVLKLFEEQKSFFSLTQISKRHPELGNLETLFKATLLLHDIGKPLGTSATQAQYNLPLARIFLTHWGFTEPQIQVALAWIQGSHFGEWIKEEVTLDSALTLLTSQAESVGMHFSDWVECAFLFYVSDAASYPHIQETSFIRHSHGQLSPQLPALKTLVEHTHETSERSLVLNLVSAHELNHCLTHTSPLISSETDQEVLKELRSHASASERQKALEQLSYNYTSFLELLPLSDDGEKTQIEELLMQTQEDLDRLIWMLKFKNHRLRPYLSGIEKDPSLEGVALESLESSFPSGHAALAQLHGLILSKRFPTQKESILSHARQIGQGRVILGLHYPSDVKAGQEIGEEFFHWIEDQPAIQPPSAQLK